MSSKSGQTRASGQAAASEVAKVESEELGEHVAVELPEERRRRFRSPGFSRARIGWGNPDEAMVMARVQVTVQRRLLELFADAYEVINAIYDVVRTPEVDPATGETRRDEYGFVVWRTNAGGGYDEDFTRLTRAQREHFMFLLTTRLFDWEQRAADVWGEAMYAKAVWEERFAIDYDAPMEGTIDDRRAAANKSAADERYFAVYMSLYSRKADALVRSMNQLAQRLKESLVL